MKITKSQLKQIIKEELKCVLSENVGSCKDFDTQGVIEENGNLYIKLYASGRTMTLAETKGRLKAQQVIKHAIKLGVLDKKAIYEKANAMEIFCISGTKKTGPTLGTKLKLDSTLKGAKYKGNFLVKFTHPTRSYRIADGAPKEPKKTNTMQELWPAFSEAVKKLHKNWGTPEAEKELIVQMKKWPRMSRAAAVEIFDLIDSSAAKRESVANILLPIAKILKKL